MGAFFSVDIVDYMVSTIPTIIHFIDKNIVNSRILIRYKHTPEGVKRLH